MGKNDKKWLTIFILFVVAGITFCCAAWVTLFGGGIWLINQLSAFSGQMR